MSERASALLMMTVFISVIFIGCKKDKDGVPSFLQVGNDWVYHETNYRSPTHNPPFLEVHLDVLYQEPNKDYVMAYSSDSFLVKNYWFVDEGFIKLYDGVNTLRPQATTLGKVNAKVGDHWGGLTNFYIYGQSDSFFYSVVKDTTLQLPMGNIDVKKIGISYNSPNATPSSYSYWSNDYGPVLTTGYSNRGPVGDTLVAANF
jgi:hypothetical protein